MPLHSSSESSYGQICPYLNNILLVLTGFGNVSKTRERMIGRSTTYSYYHPNLSLSRPLMTVLFFGFWQRAYLAFKLQSSRSSYVPAPASKAPPSVVPTTPELPAVSSSPSRNLHVCSRLFFGFSPPSSLLALFLKSSPVLAAMFVPPRSGLCSCAREPFPLSDVRPLPPSSPLFDFPHRLA